MSQTGYVMKSDIWALGCLILELCNVPMSNQIKPHQLVGQIPESYHGLREFTDLCFERSLKDRPSASQLLKHAFITQPITVVPISALNIGGGGQGMYVCPCF